MSTENQLVKQKKQDISAQVLSKVEAFQANGELQIPKNYSPQNALKSAYLILSETKNKDGKLALDHCSKQSVAEALLKMVVWGLSPLKKQCDFIMYGNKLECSIEYTGNIALAKRYGNLKDIKAHAVFEKDEFAFEVDPSTGGKKITKHTQTLESMGSKNVKGAYAILEFNNGTFDAEIMSIGQIKDAWNQGAMKGNSPAHKNFPDQMAKKTVINRACKLIIRGSDDSILIDDEDKKPIDVAAADTTQDISENANKRVYDDSDIEDAEYEEAEQPEASKEDEEAENQRLYEEAMEEEQKGQMKMEPDF